MRCRALHQDAALGHAESTIFVPLLKDGHRLAWALSQATIVMQTLAEHLADSLRKLKETRDNARARQNDLTVLKREASPALTEDHKVRILTPDSSAQLYEEWI